MQIIAVLLGVILCQPVFAVEFYSFTGEIDLAVSNVDESPYKGSLSAQVRIVAADVVRIESARAEISVADPDPDREGDEYSVCVVTSNLSPLRVSVAIQNTNGVTLGTKNYTSSPEIYDAYDIKNDKDCVVRAPVTKQVLVRDLYNSPFELDSEFAPEMKLIVAVVILDATLDSVNSKLDFLKCQASGLQWHLVPADGRNGRPVYGNTIPLFK